MMRPLGFVGLIVCTAAMGIGCSSSTRSTDTIPPASVWDLRCDAVRGEQVVLSWSVTGDDGNEGVCAAYDLRFATKPINDSTWDSAEQVTNLPVPSADRACESIVVGNLDPNVVYYFALKAMDDAGNRSVLSNVAIGDKTAPHASIGLPVSGTTVSGTAPIHGSVSDNHEIDQVEVLIDWVPVSAVTFPRWSLIWDCSAIGNGSRHTIRYRARDAAGNIGYSDPAYVTVSSEIIDTLEPDVTVNGGYVGYTDHLTLTLVDAESGIDLDSVAIDIYDASDTENPYSTDRDRLVYEWRLSASTMEDLRFGSGEIEIEIPLAKRGVEGHLHAVIYDGHRFVDYDPDRDKELYIYSDFGTGVHDLSGNRTEIVEGWLTVSHWAGPNPCCTTLVGSPGGTESEMPQ